MTDEIKYIEHKNFYEMVQITISLYAEMAQNYLLLNIVAGVRLTSS